MVVATLPRLQLTADSEDHSAVRRACRQQTASAGPETEETTAPHT